MRTTSTSQPIREPQVQQLVALYSISAPLRHQPVPDPCLRSLSADLGMRMLVSRTLTPTWTLAWRLLDGSSGLLPVRRLLASPLVSMGTMALGLVLPNALPSPRSLTILPLLSSNWPISLLRLRGLTSLTWMAQSSCLIPLSSLRLFRALSLLPQYLRQLSLFPWKLSLQL